MWAKWVQHGTIKIKYDLPDDHMIPTVETRKRMMDWVYESNLEAALDREASDVLKQREKCRSFEKASIVMKYDMKSEMWLSKVASGDIYDCDVDADCTVSPLSCSCGLWAKKCPICLSVVQAMRLYLGEGGCCMVFGYLRMCFWGSESVVRFMGITHTTSQLKCFHPFETREEVSLILSCLIQGKANTYSFFSDGLCCDYFGDVEAKALRNLNTLNIHGPLPDDDFGLNKAYRHGSGITVLCGERSYYFPGDMMEYLKPGKRDEKAARLGYSMWGTRDMVGEALEDTMNRQYNDGSERYKALQNRNIVKYMIETGISVGSWPLIETYIPSEEELKKNHVEWLHAYLNE